MKQCINDNRFILIICLLQLMAFAGCAENNQPNLDNNGAGGSPVIFKPMFIDEHMTAEDITEISFISKKDNVVVYSGDCKKESDRWECDIDQPMNTKGYMTFTLTAKDESGTVIGIGEVAVFVSTGEVDARVNMIPVVPVPPPTVIKPYVGSVIITSKVIAGKAVPLKLSLFGKSNTDLKLNLVSGHASIFDTPESSVPLDDAGEAGITVFYTPELVKSGNSYIDVVTVNVNDTTNNLSSEFSFNIDVINGLSSEQRINLPPDITSFSSEEADGMVTFTVVATDDKDSETLVYKWEIGGKVVGDNTRSITISKPPYGEVIKVTVTDTDGAGRSYSITWGNASE